MIKVINLVSLIMAPIIVAYDTLNVATVSVIVIGLLIIGWAVNRSRKGGNFSGTAETTSH